MYLFLHLLWHILRNTTMFVNKVVNTRRLRPLVACKEICTIYYAYLVKYLQIPRCASPLVRPVPLSMVAWHI